LRKYFIFFICLSSTQKSILR